VRNPPQSRVGATVEAQRLLGQARIELEFMPPGLLLETLEARLAGLADEPVTTSEKPCRCSYFHVSAVGGVVGDAGHSALMVARNGKT